MTYKTLWVENKTSKVGKPFKKVSLEDPTGGKYDVNVFSNFPHFADILPGATIEGHLEQKGQYWNLVSDEVGNHTAYQYQPVYPKKSTTNEIKQVIDYKDEKINKNTDRKEESIRLSGAQRDAVLIVTTMITNGLPYPTEDTIKALIIKWRNWFLNDKEFNNPPPF